MSLSAKKMKEKFYNIITSPWYCNRQEGLEKFISCMFYLLLLLLPFERMMQHDGKGMLLYVVIVVAVASFVRFSYFYSAKWGWILILYFCFLLLGTISDFKYFIRFGMGDFF